LRGLQTTTATTNYAFGCGNMPEPQMMILPPPLPMMKVLLIIEQAQANAMM